MLNNPAKKHENFQKERIDDSVDVNMPQLRFHDQSPLQTPVGNSEKKRTRSELSPLNENGELDVSSFIDEAVAKIIPKIIDEVKCSVKQAIEEMIEKVLNGTKEEILNEVKSEIYSATDSIREQMRYQKDELTLKMLSETEMLENYNRRDNLRIMGMSERITTDANNRTIWESSDRTISNVVELASDIGVALDKKDISIAHRLPSNKNERPIIVRFTRRISKVEILRNKRKLRENDTTMNVSIVEDLTRARLRFHNLMKSDTRIESTWTREGNLFYKWKDNNKVHCLRQLYEGGIELGYELQDVQFCFDNPSF